MNMTPNQKASHRAIDKRNSASHGLQRQKQRNSINQAELSSALAFLTGDAVQQACSLLIAQSRQLFGDGADESDGGKAGNDSASESAKSVAANSDSESPDKAVSRARNASTINNNSLADTKLQTQADSSNTKNEQKGKQQHSSQDHVAKLNNLYQKCKRAHEIIIHADESGQLDHHRTSGMSSIPSSPHPNNLQSNTTPRSIHANPGVVINTMPPPPPALGGGGNSNTGTNMPLPNLHRRSMTGPNNAPSNTMNNRLHFRRKTSDLAAVGGAAGTHKRTNSNNSHEAAASSSNKANPPEAVLNFLKKLNANGAADEGGDAAVATKGAPPPPSAAPNNKKRKASPPPTASKRPPPPPPPSTSISPNETNPKESPPETTSPKPSPPTRRSTRSSKRSTTPTEKIHGVGESVMVREKNMWYAAIVKDVDYGDGGENLVKYEVEFDNGEISVGVLPKDVREDEDE